MSAAEKMDGAAQCPSAMAIDAWVLRGRAEADPIRAHVKTCQRCEALEERQRGVVVTEKRAAIGTDRIEAGAAWAHVDAIDDVES